LRARSVSANLLGDHLWLYLFDGGGFSRGVFMPSSKRASESAVVVGMLGGPSQAVVPVVVPTMPIAAAPISTADFRFRHESLIGIDLEKEVSGLLTAICHSNCGHLFVTDMLTISIISVEFRDDARSSHMSTMPTRSPE
jgi:hypothetical protein